MTDSESTTTSTQQPAAGAASTTARPPVGDDIVTTHHVLSLADGDLAYTATAGRIVIGEEEAAVDKAYGQHQRALMGVTSYVLDDVDPATRPVTFVFNGGPGSASVFLHLGLVGPRVADIGSPQDPATPPFRLLDNPDTLLRSTDIVVIDAMSTGYSRVIDGEKPKTWHGWSKDVEQVAELIRVWVTRNDRWTSPLFLLGESYGTVRAVSVAERLQEQYAMFLSGIILVSSVLDFGSQDFGNLRWDEACIHFLPTYAAIAWYHGRHEGRTLDEVLAEAEEFASGPYRLALAKGRRLGTQERSDVVERLASLTGLSADYVDRADLRIEHMRFCTELLRAEGKVVGRIDGRYVGPLRSRVDETADTDPSGDGMDGAFAAAMQHYLRAELGVTSEMRYVLGAPLWQSWNYHEFEGRPVNVTDKLERVMRAQPGLRVRIEFGRFDLATPYFAALDMLDHLHLDDAAFDRIETAFFDTGHMPYVGRRAEESAGIRAFIEG